MAEAHTSNEALAEELNHLYWDSELTVEAIGDELGVRKSALYSAIRPIPAGVTCDDCGERMVFTNRTHRATRTATCRSCGRETEVTEDEASELQHGFAGGHLIAEVVGERWDEWRREIGEVPPRRMAMIGGAAVLGIAAGAAAVRMLRRMS